MVSKLFFKDSDSFVSMGIVAVVCDLSGRFMRSLVSDRMMGLSKISLMRLCEVLLVLMMMVLGCISDKVHSLGLLQTGEGGAT